MQGEWLRILVQWWPAVLAVVFVAGLWLGMWLEAIGWRSSAGDYRRRESGGKLYVVREDADAQVRG